jgi:hypothetical protein
METCTGLASDNGPADFPLAFKADDCWTGHCPVFRTLWDSGHHGGWCSAGLFRRTSNSSHCIDYSGHGLSTVLGLKWIVELFESA